MADDAGATSGILCVVTEETERVIGERRLALLHRLGAQLSSANTTAEVLAGLGRSLEQAPADLPFTLVYALDEGNQHARRVAVCTTWRPDVALLDTGLSVMDGYELGQRLRELFGVDGAPSTLRLVAVTGYGQDKDRERSARAGFDCHLVKPIDLDQLARAIGDPTP